MSVLHAVITATIDGGAGMVAELKIEHEALVVDSLGPKPNKRWSFTDSAGHFHAYDLSDDRDPYPTLRTRVEVVPCSDADHDEDCDGANVTHQHCLICDEEIVPARIPGPHTTTIPGRSTWAVVVPEPDVSARTRERRSIRLVSDKAEWFGIATVEDVVVSGGLFGTTGRTTYRGIGRLGRRDPERAS